MQHSSATRSGARRSRTFGLWIGSLVVALTIPLLVSPAVQAATGGRLTARPSTAIAGETVRLKGKMPTRVKRKVVLQRRDGGRWRRVAAKRTRDSGRFVFKIAAPRATKVYRVRAPRARIGPRTYKAVTTPRRKVTVVKQTASLALPTDAAVGEAVGAVASFTPVRAGRVVRLQLRAGSTWVDSGVSQQDASGQAELPVDTSTAGTSTYRAVTSAWRGAPMAASPPRTITVTTAASDSQTDPVTGVVADPGLTQVDLTWSNPDDPDYAGVVVRRATGTTAPATPTSGAAVTDTTGETHTDAGLNQGTTYSYALFAYDWDGAHAPAAKVTVTTLVPDSTPPGPVTGLAATATSPARITLTWTNPTDADLDGLVIRRAAGSTAPSSPTTGQAVADLSPPVTTYADEGVAPGQQYSYAVFAYDRNDNHSTRATATATTPNASQGDWMQLGHDAGNTSWSPTEQAITPGNVGQLGEEWHLTGGGSPAVDDGVLFVAAEDGAGTGALTAYDLSNASVVWSIPTGSNCTGPLTLTDVAVHLLCNGTIRAYSRAGEHPLLWDTTTTDPGQTAQQLKVMGDRLLAWSSNRVAAYRLSDGQRVWQQLLPSGAGSIYDVAADGTTVVVAYDDRVRALSLTSGAQLWSRGDVPASSLVVAGGWVYTTSAGALRQLSLTSGGNGWTRPDDPATSESAYRVVGADGDSVYVWDAFFDFGPPSPSVLRRVDASDGSVRWSADVPSRIATIAITGDLVWVTSTDIYSQGRSSDMLALRRSSGEQLRQIGFADNIYRWTDVAFAGGKAIINQGGSFGDPEPARLRVYGLAGPVPDITTEVLPLATTAQSYSSSLQVAASGSPTWSLVSGQLPTGLSLSATGVLSGSPTSAATWRFRVRVTATNGRWAEQDFSLQVLPGGTPDWGSYLRDATRNAFQPFAPGIDLDTAPTLGPRWNTAEIPDYTTGDFDPVTVGDRLYAVRRDGVLRAWSTTGTTANRAPLWSRQADLVGGYYTSSPTVAGDRLIVLDSNGGMSAVSTSTGTQIWRTPDASPGEGTESVTVSGTTAVMVGLDGGIRAWSTVDGAPLWGGAATFGPAGESLRWGRALSSDGTRVFAVTGCQLYALSLSTGELLWNTPITSPEAPDCNYFVRYPHPPVVADGSVYAATPWGMLRANAASGAVELRRSSAPSGAQVVVGGVWIVGVNERLRAFDATTGRLLWTASPAVISDGEFSVSRDLILLQGAWGNVQGVSRLTGELVWDGGSDAQGQSGPAIGGSHIFINAGTGIRAYGPLS